VKKHELIVRYPRDKVSQAKTDWERLRRMTDDEVERAALADPDAPPTDFDFWRDAALVTPGERERVTLRLDREVVAFFRHRGPGYQRRMNAVLGAYVEAQKPKAG
jgi:uncharacterized protein (DUF4415 family)